MSTGQPATPAPAPTAAPAAATAPPAAPVAPAPAAASPPAPTLPATPAQKRATALANLEKARAAKAAKTAPPAAPAAPAPSDASPAGATAEGTPPAAEPKGPTLAQMQLQLRKAERELQQLKASGDASKADLELLAALRDPAKRWDALGKLDVRYDDWTQRLLTQAGVETPAPEPVHPEVAKLRAELDELKGKHTTAEQQAQQAIAERDYTRRVEFARKLVADGGDKYALTAAMGAEAQLLVLHEQMRRDEAIESPDPHEVAARFEKLQEETLLQQLGGLAKTAKGKALLAKVLGVQLHAPTPVAASTDSAPVPNNSMSGERASNGVPADFHKWSPQKKREWAMGRSKQRASA